jgi:hypothetical protein
MYSLGASSFAWSAVYGMDRAWRKPKEMRRRKLFRTMQTVMTTNTNRKSALAWAYCFGALGEYYQDRSTTK